MVAVTLVVVLAMALINGVVVRVAMDFLNNTFSAVNNEENPDNPAPTTSLRSGGPGSLVSWASLGNQGRAFVGGGATAQELGVQQDSGYRTDPRVRRSGICRRYQGDRGARRA